ncbi:MAG: cytochrome P450 [Actinomycetota bacterium]
MAMTLTADDILNRLFNTPEGRRDPYPLYRMLHERAPFHRRGQDDIWYACHHTTCRKILLDNRLGHDQETMFRRPGRTDGQLRRLSDRMAPGRRRSLSMLTENPPDHTRLRYLASRAFTLRRVEMLRPRIAKLADERLDRMADRGESDVIEDLAFPLPVRVIGELLGVPFGDRQRFPALGMLADRPDATKEELGQAQRSFEALENLFTDLITERRARPRQDLLSELVAVCDEDDGRLSEDELMATAQLLFFAGFLTTNLIGNGLLALLRHPDEMARLWADGSLVASAVEEMLRYDSPVPMIGRHVLEGPVELEGIQIAQGQSIFAVVAAANRDPERFADPDRFDVGRPDNHPLSLGAGIHHCLGAPLARVEAQVVFGKLRERFATIELLDPDPPLASGPLRGLRSLRVRIRPR